MKTGRLLVLLAVLTTMLPGCRKPADTGRLETLRIGFLADPLAALLYIAKEKGMFQRRGLEVVFRNYEAGKYAMEDLVKGEVEMAICTEFVLALLSFVRDDLRAIGTVSTANNTEVIARKDHGISEPEDLKGKRVGVSKGTNAEFLLGSFLALNGIRLRDVEIVDLKPSEIVAALSAGRIDAACLYPPFLTASSAELGGNAQSWTAQDGQDYFYLLTTTDAIIRERPLAISALLDALLEAESFLEKHNPEARAILVRELGIAPAELVGRMSNIRFLVSLNQELLTLMEDEARWAMTYGLVDAAKAPNFFRSLHVEALDRLRPEAVGVIH